MTYNLNIYIKYIYINNLIMSEATPSEAPELSQVHYEIIKGKVIHGESQINSDWKRIHFIDCVFEQWSKIPNNAQISGRTTNFLGKCKFGDGVKIMIDWGNVWDENTFGSACEFHGSQTNGIRIWNNNTIWYACELGTWTIVGNDNDFDSFLRTANFVSFGDNNVIGRNAKIGNHITLGNGNIVREGGSIHGITKMGVQNLFDPTAIYSMNEGAEDVGEKWDTSETVLARMWKLLRKALGQ